MMKKESKITMNNCEHELSGSNPLMKEATFTRPLRF